VSVLYRDIRTYGPLEHYYRDARRSGVRFFRFEETDPPRVEPTEEGLQVSFRDLVLGRDVLVRSDMLVLSAGLRASDTEELASILKVARNPDGFFQEAHVKLRPVEMANEAIYVCGTAHGPKLISEAVAQAMAAASRAATFLSQSEITLSVVTAKVDQERCASCLICVRACPYGVPRINREGVSEIDEALCRGCGVCAAECPAKAIELNWYEDQQVMSKVEALLKGVL
jgi:heterodisulfide reductase subunit A-like polyferredoxin